MTEEGILRFLKRPEFRHPFFLVGWKQDAGKVGSKVVEFLNKRLQSEEFCQIKPEPFFSLEEVQVKGDVVQFPQSRFSFAQKKDLITLVSNEPQFEWYRFLDSILDVAERCKTKILYTVSGTISLISHASPRRIFAVFNEPRIQKRFEGSGLVDMDYHGKSALSSYLLWLARKRDIPGVSLWIEIPFYLAPLEDPRAWRKVLEFFNQRLHLDLNLEEISSRIKTQNEKIYRLRKEKRRVDSYLGQLEAGSVLSEREQKELIKEVYQSLKGPERV